jgi:Fic family protein
MQHVSAALPDGRYLHWNDLRWRPTPAGLSHKEWWFAQKIGRRGARVEIPGFTDADGRPFWFCRLPAIDRATHELDRRDAAREMLEALGDEGARHAYRVDQLVEEAISLEGATLTTRALAKEIIRDGRKPGSQGERMVVNNYQAMVQLLKMTGRDLTIADLLEIHAVLGADSLDVEDAAGRLRRDDEPVRVEDAQTGDVWFTPPLARELPALLDSMLTFANSGGSEPFVHPLVKAIVLHFWMAYLHPFVDGNGRMARALFYRQQAALLFLVRNPHLGLTVVGHRNSHSVSYLTARKDLQQLESGGYLARVRVGRTDRYLPRREVGLIGAVGTWCGLLPYLGRAPQLCRRRDLNS